LSGLACVFPSASPGIKLLFLALYMNIDFSVNQLPWFSSYKSSAHI